MAWLPVVLTILQIVLEWIKGQRARLNSDDDILEKTRAKRIELYEALSERDGGRLSRIASARRDRLRILAMGVRKDNKPSD